MLIADDAAEIMVRAEAKAAQLVSTHREAIFALARQLYVRGSLTGDEVRAILSRGGSPMILQRCATRSSLACSLRSAACISATCCSRSRIFAAWAVFCSTCAVILCTSFNSIGASSS
jgi:hypothetical protein